MRTQTKPQIAETRESRVNADDNPGDIPNEDHFVSMDCGVNDVQAPRNYTICFSPVPSSRYYARARTRQARSRMSMHYHRRSNGGSQQTSDRNNLHSVARVITYDSCPEQPPSTSRSSPNMQNDSVDCQREAQLGSVERPQRADSPAFEAESDGPPHERTARSIAKRLLYHARTNVTIDERSLQCFICGLLPMMPVTGLCGHTRCLECIQRHETCSCGMKHTPWLLNINIVAQELTHKIILTEPNLRLWMSNSQDVSSRSPHQSHVHVTGNLTPSEYEIIMNEDRLAVPLKNNVLSSTTETPKNKSEEKHSEEPSVKYDYIHNGPNDFISDKSEPINLENVINNVDMSEEEAWGPVDLSTRTVQEEESSNPLSRIPITPQARIKYANHLIQEGQILDAVPHLARAATANDVVASDALQMLIEAILELNKTRDVTELEGELREAISAQATSKWLLARDLECVYCYDTLCKPVTTPCGHTFCRSCLERSLDYRGTCALCMQSLDCLNFKDVRITEFVCAALVAIGATKTALPPDPHVIPILACTVAFPGMPCPLFLFDPRYWYMIRRILESESRKFGMVAYEREGTYSEYGTILELRDCVHLQDGCTIVSTIGISRFRVVERDVWDGWCDVARIDPVVDIPIMNNQTVADLRMLARHISYKAAVWISGFSHQLRAKIHTAFGAMPAIDAHGRWWKEPDGPAWLWWLISILPLKLEIKVLILATDSLLKRMRAVLRTLDTSLAQPRQSVFEYESALADWWQQRHL